MPKRKHAKKTFYSLLKIWYKSVKYKFFFNEIMVLADVPSCSESLYTDSGFHNYVISTESGGKKIPRKTSYTDWNLTLHVTTQFYPVLQHCPLHRGPRLM